MTLPDSTAADVEKAEQSRLATELRRCIQPGAKIALLLEGYMVLTSILWLSEPQGDGSLHAGVRLLGVSALPVEPRELAAPWGQEPRRTASARLDPAIIRKHQ